MTELHRQILGLRSARFPKDDPRLFVESEAKELRELASLLFGAFTWRYTKEGHDYWSKMYDRFLVLAARAKQ